MEQERNHTDDYIESMGKMHAIVREMKEIPELPSEIPQDVSHLERVEFLEQGVHTYMSGHEYPYKGFPYTDFVEKIDVIKKLGRGMISGFYHRMKSRRLSLLTLIPSVWVFKDLVWSSIYSIHRMIERFKLKPVRYCTSVRELYRAFSLPQKNSEMRNMLRDILCMILENDNAYRFRFQDIIVELDKDMLKKNPRKELIRLFTIMQSREVNQEINDTWKLLKYVISYYLLFDRKLLKILTKCLMELDTQVCKLDEGDRHWCEKRVDYNFKHKDVNLIPRTQLQSSVQVPLKPVGNDSGCGLDTGIIGANSGH